MTVNGALNKITCIPGLGFGTLNHVVGVHRTLRQRVAAMASQKHTVSH